MSDTMKAVRLHAFGAPEVLRYEDAPRPEPGPGEILVRVHAIGLNPPDWYLREGYRSLPPEWQPHPVFPLILGSDVSGTVERLGTGVTEFTVGDEVYAMVRFPDDVMEGGKAYAEFVSVPVSDLAPKPVGLDHAQAAAAPMSLLTAWQFLIDLGHEAPNPFQPTPHLPRPLAGQTVLVNGAGGGVGHLAVQLARWKGAHVIAVASGKNETLLLELGADQFIDYTQVAADDVVRGVDIVLDCVGKDAPRFLKVLKPGGALFQVFPLGFEGQDAADRLGITVSATQVRSSGAQLRDVAPLLSNGTLRVVIDSRFPLAQAHRAHERAERGSIQGKIVLTVEDEATDGA
ncbi:NADP-dependent oxidoreductase [Aureimonas sp. AU20]|uniref:NADP-dependent oxidoreductase n=1 Tax=Aureimonas sp. AU20 TaxID=1349819 RepID=UPI000722C69A|nr:NADP-dependent oxidoreductase [Aureimonas sp. AU20]ALN71928.1 hypothetical protein M673_04320 [Aureimonas sp. AU20]